jgi:ABC-type multidrug transport system ATPase subunit
MEYAQNLLEEFGLNPKVKIKNMSRGERARLGLIAALAHRPELLVLDEPSSGLDVSVRRDILEEIINSVVDSGRTILFSSHLLDEVERIADNIIMIHKGKIIINGHVDDIKANHRRYIVKFDQETAGMLEYLINDQNIICSKKVDDSWLIASKQPILAKIDQFNGKIIKEPPVFIGKYIFGLLLKGEYP